MTKNNKLDTLREEYVADLPIHISNIYQYWQQVINQPDDKESLDNLMRICHKLAGTGASFGFNLLSQHTREIEHFLRPAHENMHNVDDQSQLKISDLINQLDSDCKQA